MGTILGIFSAFLVAKSIFNTIGWIIVFLSVLLIFSFVMRKSIIKYFSSRVRDYISEDNYNKYVDMVSDFFFYVIIRYPLALFAVAFFSTPDKKHLTKFTDMETVDWDLAGDPGWNEKHLIGNNPLSFINRVRWLWRNGYAGKAYREFGVKLNGLVLSPVTTGVDNFKVIKVENQPYFQFRKFTKIGPVYLEKYFGWALEGPQTVDNEPVSKLVFTIRFRTNTN